MKLNYDESALREHIARVVEKTLDMDLAWDWPCGVAYYGVSRAFEATGQTEYLDRLRDRVDEHMALGLPVWTVNACAMGHCLLNLYAHTGEDRYLQLIRSKLDYLQNHAPRFAKGVLQHTVSANNDFPEQAWADTLFMAGYFMLRAGVVLGDGALVDDALNQFYWHVEYLQNKAAGIWYHAYNNLEGGHMSGFYWGRANAWAAYTESRVRKVLPQPYLYPAYMHTDCSLRDQLTALRKLQRADGLWGTILDDEDSYGEVSATAGIAAAMVNNNNTLHTACAQKALDAVLLNISSDGRVQNVSGGTAVMLDRDGYRSIPKDWTQGWGQGLALALLAAALEAGDGNDLAR